MHCSRGYHALITQLSCTANVADHAMITQLPCTGHVTDHALLYHFLMVFMNILVGQQQQQGGRHREQTVDTVGAGEGGMNGERSMETYTLPYAK